MTNSLSGRAVAVTGGTGGLGRAVVGALVESGADCFIPNLLPQELSNFPYRDHARVRIVDRLDIADESAASAFYSGIPNLWASINLVGGFAMGKFAKADMAGYDAMIRMNLTTCFLSCRESVRVMEAGGKGGRIVNVAARPALEPRFGAGKVLYTTSKAAVSALTASLAAELAGSGILVNAIAPETLDTPANRQAMPNADFGRWAKVDEVARIVLFLASPENAVTNGATVPVYGRG